MRLFIAAEPRELEGFLPYCTNVSPVEFPVHWARVGNWKEQQMIAIANGAGPVRAAAAVDCVLSITRALAVCSVGFCGALDPELGIGDVFVAKSVNGLSAMRPVTEVTHRTGALVSVEHIAGTAEHKQELRARGFDAVEMEAAGVAERASHYGAPFYCVRAVTDVAGESFANDFEAALKPDGRFAVSNLLVAALARPFERVPELFRLQRRCGIAARRLGGFLDACEF
ncbi:MAG TPA: hypothetical protein DEQ47_09195 [Solibacterales bacterium]|nr:hypothetical protein [Bryobacterales bacterium]